MRLLTTSIPEIFVIEPQVFTDPRGWFMETWSEGKLKDIGIEKHFVQDNHSFTLKKGTIRGLHFQNNPSSQFKIVRVIAGSVLDVAVDLRKGSKTYLKWVAVELSAENKRQLIIPRGFAHGFLTLTDGVETVYKADNPYSVENDRSIRYDDVSIGIEWGIETPILSAKDENAPILKDSDCNFTFVD